MLLARVIERVLAVKRLLFVLDKEMVDSMPIAWQGCSVTVRIVLPPLQLTADAQLHLGTKTAMLSHTTVRTADTGDTYFPALLL